MGFLIIALHNYQQAYDLILHLYILCRVVLELHDKEYKDVELSHMLADNCAMQLLKNPKQFDVIVTDNLFGDMLSDQA